MKLGYNNRHRSATRRMMKAANRFSSRLSPLPLLSSPSVVPASRGFGQFYANRSAIHLKSRFCTSAARHPSLLLTTHTSRHGLHRLTGTPPRLISWNLLHQPTQDGDFLPVRRFADVWTSPLMEEVNTLALALCLLCLHCLLLHCSMQRSISLFFCRTSTCPNTSRSPSRPCHLPHTPRLPHSTRPGRPRHKSQVLERVLHFSPDGATHAGGVVRHLVKKSKARLAPSELTTVEKANYYMKEALKDGYVHDALVDTTTCRRSE